MHALRDMRKKNFDSEPLGSVSGEPPLATVSFLRLEDVSGYGMSLSLKPVADEVILRLRHSARAESERISTSPSTPMPRNQTVIGPPDCESLGRHLLQYLWCKPLLVNSMRNYFLVGSRVEELVVLHQNRVTSRCQYTDVVTVWFFRHARPRVLEEGSELLGFPDEVRDLRTSVSPGQHRVLLSVAESKVSVAE